MTKTRRPGTAPRLDVNISEEQWAIAIKSKSGGCLIADAIKSQFPNLTSVSVDMATIRVSDRARGERYTWLTPPPAQMLLLSFDQGWNQSTEQIKLRDAVKVQKMTRPPGQISARQQRLAVLEAKDTSGAVLTRRERQSLAKMHENDERYPDPLPTTPGPVTDIVPRRAGNATVIGGPGLVKPNPEKHPNLLAGRDRHFGAKLANPGVAFQEAVDKAVAEHLARAAEATGGATQTGAPTAPEG